MTYSIMQLIELMGEQFPLLLNSSLNRFPIIVAGEDVELVDDISDSVAALSPHRHRLVFWRDFTSQDELLAVWEEEKHNYEVSRTIACCFSSNLGLALERITHFSSWVVALPIGARALGIDVNRDAFPKILKHIARYSVNCGILRVKSPSSLNFTLMEPYQSNLDVEKRIVSKILTRKRQSLERIRRLLRKSLRGVNIPEHMMGAILKLDDESEKITHDMFDEEVSNYVHAARRAVTLLSRIRLARELGASTALTERNLYEAIGWEGGELPELIRFIMAEWHEDFSDCVKGGTLSGLGAWVDSMWGT
ncbi:MAG: hypothetical protein JSW61_00210 [Candidatus Thorarchaeota archaeon]|nr:MAG: hypothetical protein JSW61_00210 [Candidatus Thorarchaeota archaeon]